MIEVVASTETDIYVKPGDKVILSQESNGHRRLVLEKDIEEPAHFNRAVIFKFVDEFGLENGIGGAFGKAKE